MDGISVLYRIDIKRGEEWPEGKGSYVLRPLLVAAGLAGAGNENGGAGASASLARAVGEGVQNAGNSGIGREDPEQYDRDSRKRHDERNQYRTQDQPAFRLSAGPAVRTRLAQSTTLPALTLPAVSN